MYPNSSTFRICLCGLSRGYEEAAGHWSLPKRKPRASFAVKLLLYGPCSVAITAEARGEGGYRA